MTDEKKNVNIIYNKKTLCSFQCKPDSSIKDLKKLLQNKYYFEPEDIILSQNDKILNDDNEKLKLILNK